MLLSPRLELRETRFEFAAEEATQTVARAPITRNKLASERLGAAKEVGDHLG